MPTIRKATPADAPLITTHRHVMFADNAFATESRLDQTDAAFEPWVRDRLTTGDYIGLLLSEEESGPIVAGAGILFHDFAPHWMHLEPSRAYLLNFYTAPEARGRGYAPLLLQASIDECRKRNATVITLHASRFGRPIYEKHGFEASTEMLLRLDNQVA